MGAHAGRFKPQLSLRELFVDFLLGALGVLGGLVVFVQVLSVFRMS
jgi:hypothetical protein